MRDPSDGEVRVCGKGSALADQSELNTPLTPGDPLNTITTKQ